MRKKVFIVGTGRSGTHWLGYILDSSPEIKVTIEKNPIFRWVTHAAINNYKRMKLLPQIIVYYNIVPLFTNKIFADKSHPNLWHIESLAKYVPGSTFIGIIRDPYATVSSMLLHKGVLKWIYEWESYPVPNQFLGISKNNMEEYRNLDIVEKCTWRWIAHKNRLSYLDEILTDNFLLLDYNALIENTKSELQKIENFIGLKQELNLPIVKKESKEKWKINLSSAQISLISETLIKYNHKEATKIAYAKNSI